MLNYLMMDYVRNNKKLVKMSQSTTYPNLYVLKYKPKVFYDGLWNPVLENLRGTVVDRDFNLMAYPFRKIYNRHEIKDNDFNLDDNILAVRKINGFMAAVTYNKELGECLVSTTGSLDSLFVQRAKDILPESVYKYIKKTKNDLKEPITYLFEIVHPDDPHVIEEDVGAYLLSGRVCNWLDNMDFSDYSEYYDVLADQMKVKRPEYKYCKWVEILEELKEIKHEGWVCYNLDQDTKPPIKLKSPYYNVTKLFGRMKDVKLLERLEQYKDNKGLLRERLDEEYYPLIDHIFLNKDTFSALNEQEKFSYIKEFLK